MSKARMQPQAQTGIVWKISIAIIFLLAVVLYKTNDYFRQEKWQIAKSQLRTQVINTKTSVSSQIGTLKKVLSSYEYGLNEAQMNWVSLDPFFLVASAQVSGPREAPNYRIQKVVSRANSPGQRWTPQFVENIMSSRVISAEAPIGILLFQDRSGQSYLALRMNQSQGRALIVMGQANYFQKFFDVTVGQKSMLMLHTTENLIAGHSQAGYVGASYDAESVSWKGFLVEREEIAGTNLVILSTISAAQLNKGLAVPWSIAGLIIGFGLLLIGLLMYMTSPLERRLEKFKKQEREQIYQSTLAESTALIQSQNAQSQVPKGQPKDEAAIQNAVSEMAPFLASEVSVPQTATDIVKAKIDQALEEMSRPENLSLKNKVNRVFENEEDSVELKTESADPIVEFKMSNPVENPTEPIKVSPPAGSVVLDEEVYEPLSEEFSINKIMTPVQSDEQFAIKSESETKNDSDAVAPGTGDMVASPQSIRDSFLKKLSEEKFAHVSIDESESSLSAQLEDTKTDVPIAQSGFSFEKADELVQFDVDKALSVEDLDVARIEKELKPKNVNAEGTLFGLPKPTVQLNKKSYKVDSIQVAIRRPEKT